MAHSSTSEDHSNFVSDDVQNMSSEVGLAFHFRCGHKNAMNLPGNGFLEHNFHQNNG